MKATDSLPNNPDADLNQVQETLKLMHFKPNTIYTQMKVMCKWQHKLKEILLQEYGDRCCHAGIQLLKDLPRIGVFEDDKFSNIFYFSPLMQQPNMCILNNYNYETCNFAQNLSLHVGSKSSSKLLLKAKGLSNRKEGNKTQSTKY